MGSKEQGDKKEVPDKNIVRKDSGSVETKTGNVNESKTKTPVTSSKENVKNKATEGDPPMGAVKKPNGRPKGPNPPRPTNTRPIKPKPPQTPQSESLNKTLPVPSVTPSLPPGRRQSLVSGHSALSVGVVPSSSSTSSSSKSATSLNPSQEPSLPSKLAGNTSISIGRSDGAANTLKTNAIEKSIKNQSTSLSTASAKLKKLGGA